MFRYYPLPPLERFVSVSFFASHLVVLARLIALEFPIVIVEEFLSM